MGVSPGSQSTGSFALENYPQLRGCMKELESLVVRVANGDNPGVLVDYLFENLDDDRAHVIAALSEPFEIVKYLFDSIDPALAFELPFTDLEKLELLTEHSNLDNRTLFELACDFAEAVLPVFESWNPADHRPKNALVAMRKWAAGDLVDQEMREARANFLNSVRAEGDSRIAVQAVSIATGFDSWADHCIGVFAARDTAKTARKILGDDGAKLQLEICRKRIAATGELTKRPESNDI